MALPVVDVTLPAVLNGKSNGNLPDDILVKTPGLQGGPLVRLVEPAARAWRALAAAALAAGHVLKAVGPHDSYRPLSTQDRIFRERYTTDPIPGRPTKRFEGQTWFQLPGTAVAAVPGTSNHGFGLAVDTGIESDEDPAPERIDQATLDWLLDGNARRFGWSWEVQTEPWHLRYFAGDDIPAAVLAHEANEGELIMDAEVKAAFEAVRTDIASTKRDVEAANTRVVQAIEKLDQVLEVLNRQ